MKLIILTASNLGPYHKARFNKLAEIGINLTAARIPVPEYYRPWKPDLSNVNFSLEQPYETLANTKGWTSILNHTRRYLRQKAPDVVITTGYNSKYIWATAICCRELGIPCLLYLVSCEKDRHRNWVKEWVKSWFCRRYYDGALVTGIQAQNYAAKLRIPENYIWRVGNVVDNAHFAENGNPTHQLDEISGRYFLAVSRLSKEKNLARLIKAYSLYRQKGGSWSLVIAGTGPEEETFREMVPAHDKEHVYWLGWVGYEGLPELYKNAGCFILASLVEPWGLVVNEAMAAGLPVLVSRHCGCQPELCWRGVNGYDFDPHDVNALTSLMLRMSSGTVDLVKMGEISQEIISLYSLDNWANAVKEGVSSFCSS